MIKAALFDLDGTLQDSEILWVKATGEYIRNFGVPLSAEQETAIVYGRSWRNIYNDVLNLVPSLKCSLAEMADAVRIYYAKLLEKNDIAIPESITLLKRLSKIMPCAIVSGSTRRDIGDAVQSLGIADNISFFIGCEDYGPGKPAPDCFLMGAKRIGVAPVNCVVFEDSSVGIAAAKAAGMTAVAISRPGHPLQSLKSADLTLENLNDFNPADF